MSTEWKKLQDSVAALDKAMRKRNFFAIGKDQEAADLAIRRSERAVIDAARYLVAASPQPAAQPEVAFHCGDTGIYGPNEPDSRPICSADGCHLREPCGPGCRDNGNFDQPKGVAAQPEQPEPGGLTDRLLADADAIAATDVWPDTVALLREAAAALVAADKFGADAHTAASQWMERAKAQGTRVRFLGVDPVEPAKGAVPPMLCDSWRFGFTAADDGSLMFGLRDDGPFVAYEAVEQPKPTRAQKMRDAGYTRRPSWKSLPSDSMDDEPEQPEPGWLTDARIKELFCQQFGEDSWRVVGAYFREGCRAVEREVLSTTRKRSDAEVVLLPSRPGQPAVMTISSPSEPDHGHWYSPAEVERLLGGEA